jgi:hypothetical protein
MRVGEKFTAERNNLPVRQIILDCGVMSGDNALRPKFTFHMQLSSIRWTATRRHGSCIEHAVRIKSPSLAERGILCGRT